VEKQNHEDLLRGRVSIMNNESQSITLFLLGGLFRLLCRGLLRRHGFFTPFHPQENTAIKKMNETGHTGCMVAVRKPRERTSLQRL
jgi:hypothetical protein